MTTPKPKYRPRPRTYNEFQVASRLNHGVEWFRQNRARLEASGFPRKDNLLGGWDSKAINLWMDKRSGLELQDNAVEDKMLEMIHARAS